MTILIPQLIDQFNTHLKSLIKAYTDKGVTVLTGYESFLTCKIIPDIIHFHFPEGLLSYLQFDEVLFFKRMEYYNSSGTKFLYTFHDVKPHAQSIIVDYQAFFLKFLEYINLFIHHGNASIEITISQYPILSAKKHIVCHHGDYLNEMKTYNESQQNAREMLGLPIQKKIVLIFGQLQFKNSNFAYEVFRQLKSRHDNALLLMAGIKPIFKRSRLNKIYYRINNQFFNWFRFNKILIHKRFSQYETYLLFTASDVVFLPHKSGLTSGLIPMSATLGKPFVYPDIGVFDEQANFCIAEKYEMNDVIAASLAIHKVLQSEIKKFDNTEWLKNNNWDLHAEKILLHINEFSLPLK
jgi:hypothetical protein